MRRKPRRAVMRLAGAEYEIDVEAVRQALDRWRLAPQASRATVQSLADHAGLSRCTVWRFLSGRPVGLMAAKRITRSLGLDVQDVLRPVRRPTTASVGSILVAARAVVEVHEDTRESIRRLEDLDSRIGDLASLLQRWDPARGGRETEG